MSDMYIPLAEKIRPSDIDEVIGQEHLLRSADATVMAGSVRDCLESGNVPSMLLWGPPGTGKTTIARLVSTHIPHSEFVSISAVSSGIGDIKTICMHAQEIRKNGIRSCVFIDEIHRFNKVQQDALLHYVEEGIITLIGASTENPSFEINAALLSRMRVFVLEPLSEKSLRTVFARAEEKLSHNFDIDDLALDALIDQSDGDARRLINLIEQLYEYQRAHKSRITQEVLSNMQLYAPKRYDKDGDEHYTLISALHTSIRSSDCHAALYWFARMLVGGEDPRYIARRLLRCAYEDIGLADPNIAQYVLTAWQTYERLGSPEGEIALASAVIHLSLSPKSNSVYVALGKVQKSVRTHKSYPPPLHARKAPTALMKDLGYGKGYVYDHDEKDGISGLEYFPKEMKREQYYVPVARGYERQLAKNLAYFERKRAELANKKE